MLVDFKVIDIIDDSNPCPTLLGIDWETDMNGVINLKKCKMIFEKMSLCIAIPLDPVEGSQYIDQVRDNNNNDDLDLIYKITMHKKYWVNPTMYG